MPFLSDIKELITEINNTNLEEASSITSKEDQFLFLLSQTVKEIVELVTNKTSPINLTDFYNRSKFDSDGKDKVVYRNNNVKINGLMGQFLKDGMFTMSVRIDEDLIRVSGTITIEYEAKEIESNKKFKFLRYVNVTDRGSEFFTKR